MDPKPKRKTTTSTEVKHRYNSKAYRRITVNLRIYADADILALIDGELSAGYSPSDAIKNLIRR